MTSNDSLDSMGLNTSPQIDQTPELNTTLRAGGATSIQARTHIAVAPEYYPRGKRSLSGIAIRAFCIGCTAVLGFGLATLLAYHGSRLWRPWAFLGTLSIFHFLEFYTTAAYNTPSAYVSSFLLTNGNQYRQAHTMALVETCITSYFFPDWQARFSLPIIILVGLIFTLVGQSVRSIAMAQAGTNFNHTVQSRRNDGHELVTYGLYAHLRHPSYFGFFWWGIGTQLMLGNVLCFVGYAGVLWYFFKRRITRMYLVIFCIKVLRNTDHRRRRETFGRLFWQGI